LSLLGKGGGKGEELKAPRYASAAATRDYIIARDIIPNSRIWQNSTAWQNLAESGRSSRLP
jgi:hypothetical protein